MHNFAAIKYGGGGATKTKQTRILNIQIKTKVVVK